MLHIFRDFFFKIRDKRVFSFFGGGGGGGGLGMGGGVAVEVIFEDFISEIV